MTTIAIDDACDIHVRIDDHTDPWRASEAVLFLHGNAESGEAWYAWVPHFSRRYRVVRPDMRGFGLSSAMPADYPWTIERLVADNITVLDRLGIARLHVVGAKLGTCTAMKLAAMHPERVASLTLLGAPASISNLAAGGPPVALVEQHGVEAWARVNMSSRLGSAMPPEAAEWWSRFMGRTAASTQIGFMRHVTMFDVKDILEDIRAPALVVTTEGSGIGSISQTREWQERIPDSRLLVLPGDSYHVAVSDADQCAQETLSFIGGLPEKDSNA